MSERDELREAAENALAHLDRALGDTDPPIPDFRGDTEAEEEVADQYPVFYAHYLLRAALASPADDGWVSVEPLRIIDKELGTFVEKRVEPGYQYRIQRRPLPAPPE